LSSMASTTIPAFLAASFCHILSTAPLLLQDQNLLTNNSSSRLYTHPILFAHGHMKALGAIIRAVDPTDSQTNLSLQLLYLPENDLFFHSNAASVLPNI
jgi:hypothetical protein